MTLATKFGPMAVQDPFASRRNSPSPVATVPMVATNSRPSGANRANVVPAVKNGSGAQVAPPSAERSTPPELFDRDQVRIISAGLVGLTATDVVSNPSIPAVDGANEAPPLALAVIPNTLFAASTFEPANRTSLILRPWVPATPNVQFVPPLTDRKTPNPSVPATITCGL